MERRPFLRRLAAAVAGIALAAAFAGNAPAGDRFILVASTTSTQDSGLFGWLLPAFTKATGIEVRVIAKGTGEAIKLGETGDVDVLFVHDKASEQKFVADGVGVRRYQLMYNDFIVVGPKTDPAHIAGGTSAADAFKKIAGVEAPFASRGDDSGTNKAEIRLWKAAGVDPEPGSGKWYLKTGSGMGPTLNTAVAKGAYALTDRGTWIAFKNKGDFEILVQGDKALFNQYGVILVNPARFPSVKVADGQAFIDWLISPAGQETIASYRIDGQELFFPNYAPGS